MTCVHKVRWSVKRPEDCRFRLSVSHYKDRIVAPDEYSGATVVTPSDSEQVLPTKDKLVRSDITVNPAPTESLATNANGTFAPSSGYVGFSEVTVDVEPSLESLTATENGLYLPESGTDGFDRVTVNVPIPEPALEPLTIDTLTQSGTFLPRGDGFSQVTAEETWDGTLYPITDETDPLFEQKVINAKHISVVAGDTVIIDGMGRGRWFGWYRGNKGGPYTSNSVTSNIFTEGFTSIRYILPITVDATLILAGYEWTTDGSHSSNATYCFFGDYLHWKVIHAS